MKRLTLVSTRKSLGLMRWEAAMALGISQRAYGQIEAGRGLPSWAVARKMESLFGVPADELLAVEGGGERLPAAGIVGTDPLLNDFQ